MRVITGRAKGRRLQTLPGLDTRPTTGVVKEAVFSIIQFELEGANVLDLFAGSGQLGIEALSRGAKHCVFVDSGKGCQAVLRQNLAHTGLAAQARLVATDALSYLATAAGPFDIAFADPPYGSNLLPGVLAALAPKMSPGGIILCEARREDPVPDTAGTIPLCRQYRYGKTQITTYRREPEE